MGARPASSLYRLAAFPLVLIVTSIGAAAVAISPARPPSVGLLGVLDRMSPPLAFEENRGQAAASIDYLARGSGYTIALSRGRATLAFAGHGTRGFLRIRAEGGRASPAAATRRLPGIANYFIGDRSRWLTGIPTFGVVRYPEVLAGIDLAFHGRGQQLEYDFLVKPGTDPNSIRLAFDGAKGLRVDGRGDLHIRLAGGWVRQPRPRAWQSLGGERQPVEVSYRPLPRGRVAFEVGPYDRSGMLLIDPVLTYSTYLGGIADDRPHGIAVDAAGSAYVVGVTPSADFPLAGPIKGSLRPDDRDAFVTKFSPNGDSLVYSTYLGGSFSGETAFDVAVDASGSAYVTGETLSPDFPTVNAFDAHFDGPSDAFVAKLSASGAALTYSTYLGGSVGGDPNVVDAFDMGQGIAVDSTGAAYVAGQTFSADFPTVNAVQPAPGRDSAARVRDAFVTKLAPSGSSLVYSTYLGGAGPDKAAAVAVDSAGSAVVAGSTHSSDFPVASPLQDWARSLDAFVSKLTAEGSSFVYSTYLGGGGPEAGDAIAVDGAGNAYVVGTTESNDFPTTPGAYATACAAGRQFCGFQRSDAFLSKLAPDGSALAYSTYFGADGPDRGNGVAVNGRGEATIVGTTQALPADGFPLVDAFQPSFGGAIDGYLAQLSADGSALVGSSYLGGNSFDIPTDVSSSLNDDVVFVTGSTNSTNFTTTPGAFDRTGGETCAETGRCDDAFVVKISAGRPPVDSTPPTVAVTAPTEGSFVRGVVLITATASDDTSVRQVQFLVDGQTVGFDAFPPHEATWHTTQHADGPATITVRASDPAGNVGTSAPVHVVVDNQPPETSISGGPSGTVNTTTATFSFEANEAGSTFACSLDVASEAPCASPVTYENLAGGPHTFAVRATDRAGNVDPSPATAAWTVFNDMFAAAWPLARTSGQLSGSSLGATLEEGEPRHSSPRGGASVWFTWTAPVDGMVVFDTAGTDFDTILAVYTGSALTKLTEVAANHSSGGTRSRVAFPGTAGTAYRIALDGTNGRSGPYTLSWSETTK